MVSKKSNKKPNKKFSQKNRSNKKQKKYHGGNLTDTPPASSSTADDTASQNETSEPTKPTSAPASPGESPKKESGGMCSYPLIGSFLSIIGMCGKKSEDKSSQGATATASADSAFATKSNEQYASAKTAQSGLSTKDATIAAVKEAKREQNGTIGGKRSHKRQRSHKKNKHKHHTK